MFTETVKHLVETHSEKILRNNPLFTKARSGILTKKECANYLHNLMFLFQYTCPHLKIAEENAIKHGYQELAEFFATKSIEEKGHDLWAKQDLKKIDHPTEKVDLAMINPETFEMFIHIRRMVDKNPISLLGHMFFVEYFTVIVSPDFLAGLERCGLQKNNFTAVTNHAELDVHHIEDDLKAMEKFITTPEHERYVLSAIEESAIHTDRFLSGTTESEWIGVNPSPQLAEAPLG